MTRYREDLPVRSRSRAQEVHETMAEVLAAHGARQLHVAETEKYAHVTYFFNGGREEEWEGETRILVPSPRDVADVRPQAGDVGRRGDASASARPGGRRLRFVVVNFANPDMVGHYGRRSRRSSTAVETTDACLGDVVEAVQGLGGVLLITADHGNAETDARAGRHEPAHRAHDEPGPACRHGSRCKSARGGRAEGPGADRHYLPESFETFTDEG